MADVSDPIVIEGDEQSRVDPALADGGIPPAVGVRNYQVFRASKAVPDQSDGRGWTYHHHVDMACWRGRLVVGWNTCEKDEDVWPSRELLSFSDDGVRWSSPIEMFPQGMSTPLRIYFYLARPTGRMLIIAGLRVDTRDTDEDTKGGLVVRELLADHTLGPIFTLQHPPAVDAPVPMFDSSSDAGFVESCRVLLADTVYLEQQDRGRLLGKRRMKWHEASAWPGGVVPGTDAKWVCGKAFSFHTRPDNSIVGLCKMGYTTASTDAGQTWSQPVVPATLVTGKAKVYSTRTRDGRYLLAYNPSARQRFPLIAVTGEDGTTYRHMRIIQGELPRQRYPGMHRSIGPQYTRGLNHWNDDGSRAQDHAAWLVYSMNKEDIWVARLPLQTPADAPVDDFTDLCSFDRWHIHSPRWSPVRVFDGALELHSADPYDDAVATRVFGARRSVSLTLSLSAQPAAGAVVSIDVLSEFGSKRPISLRLDAAQLAGLASHQQFALTIRANADTQQFSIDLDGQPVLRDQPFATECDNLHRLELRTSPYRNIGGANPIDPATDHPIPPSIYRLHRLVIA